MGVWKEPRVMYNDGSYIVSERGDSSENMRVCDLIHEDYSGWNEGLIWTIFEHIEMARILTIPFAAHRPDILAWKFKKKKWNLFVKSGYVELMKSTNKAYCTLVMESGRKWQWVWQMEITPKVRFSCGKSCMASCLRVSTSSRGSLTWSQNANDV